MIVFMPGLYHALELLAAGVGARANAPNKQVGCRSAIVDCDIGYVLS
jgi:hypothetical protein